ncbi:response regulator [Enterobacter sp. DTU_2021_1002640_1_SI_PRY_ASU_LCPMC_013]|uniref:response regulator n=1 Tax=Enterobacter sp. DTU_2021_1002640_1_SI_PRY_ASU_LCPMC_013 TaxID=3077940 RepID=UPI0027FDE3C4|nr:response regulator [Enterobacter sp. DTU_2021_1002640_1_SI_PRY_ASU_LCPMC_013]EKY3917451.1 response regulator transcription factor [Enterobacter hormaechei]WNU99079.1 response regulator [Enterobacter sp. DTU_2021_1002640_1_SI_PRY_ASU_LCPMC_013]
MLDGEKKIVLLAEDETDIAKVVIAYLERDGFEVLHAIDGEIALRIAEQNNPDFIILDIKMPKKDGWQVLRELRNATDTPIMMLTALDTDIDKVFALKTGADDYLVKPFNPAELMARVHVILKRSQYHQKDEILKIYKTKNLEINKTTHEVFVGPARINLSEELTSTEFKILMHLIRYPKRVFTREEIMDACTHEGNISERTIDSHISKLRKKIQQAGVFYVPESVRGFGYRLGD